MNNIILKSFIRALMIISVLVAIYLFMILPTLATYISPQRSINVIAWSNSLDLKCIGDFEKKTGIKVYLSYFETSEELFVKLKAGKGQSFDLIMPSHYVMGLLIKDGLIKKIDKTKLTFWDQLYPALLGHEYDPENNYGIPFAWGMYGIAIDKRYFGDAEIPNTWGLLFDKQVAPVRVGMNDDARELMQIVALYLFGPNYLPMTPEKLQAIKELLLKQKEWVTMYTDMRPNYLLTSQTAPAVLALSTPMAHLLNEYNYFKFIVPKEGTFIIIDTLAIPTISEKDDLVYTFLNYLYSHEVYNGCTQHFGFQPVMKGITPVYDFPFSEPTKQMFSLLHLFRDGTFTEDQLNEVWIALKSK